MAGKIRQRLLEQTISAQRQAASEPQVCPLCLRPVPLSQQDAHHLVPKSKGGRTTATFHRICHRQIHALLTETELARQFNTAEALRAHPALSKFADWVANKPDDFYERVRKSDRIKR